MSVKVLIPCAGLATRWHGDTPKQLTVVRGEPLLHRTVRLVREVRPDADIRIVVPDLSDDRFKIPGTKRATAKLDPDRSQADKIMSSRHLWNRNGLTVIIWGDVYVTDDAIRTILEDRDNWCVFARLGASSFTGKDHREIFGWAIPASQHALIEQAAHDCINAHLDGVLTDWSGSWELYQAIHNALGVRWKDLHNDQLLNVVEIDDWTDDFDTADDWDRWCWHWANASDEARATGHVFTHSETPDGGQ